MVKEKKYGYARVSTKEQNEDRQLLALIAAGVPKENIYVDKMTGKNFDRPEYRRLLKKIGKGSVLYIKSIDRLGRSYKDLSEQWRIITKEKGADLVVIDMPLLDTRREKNLLGTFISDIVLVLFSYVAESEFVVIHQRQKEGIAAAKARGVRFGRKEQALPSNFDEVYFRWKTKKIPVKKAAELCRMPVTTFYYKVKKYEKGCL